MSGRSCGHWAMRNKDCCSKQSSVKDHSLTGSYPPVADVGSNPAPATKGKGCWRDSTAFFCLQFYVKRCIGFTFCIRHNTVKYTLVTQAIWSSGCCHIIIYRTKAIRENIGRGLWRSQKNIWKSEQRCKGRSI